MTSTAERRALAEAQDGVRAHSMIERAAVVALLRAAGRAWSQVATEVLEAGEALSLLREPAGQLDLLAADPDQLLADALTDLSTWEAAGIGVHTVLDESYPALLRDIRERPALLFSRGRMARDSHAIAVVGSRKASDEGIRVAGTIATELVRCGVTVVSGLAAGIDTRTSGIREERSGPRRRSANRMSHA